VISFPCVKAHSVRRLKKTSDVERTLIDARAMARQGGAPPKELAQARAAYFCAACRHGHAEEAVEYLKQLNSSSAAHGAAGLALFDAAGASGLHLAAGNGHAGLVTSILNSGLLPVDVEELGRPKTLTEGGGRPVGSGRTPLHWAASGGHAEVRSAASLVPERPRGSWPVPHARSVGVLTDVFSAIQGRFSVASGMTYGE